MHTTGLRPLMFGPSIYFLSSVFVELDRVSESRSALNIYISQLRTCENLPYIGSILRELEIIPYYGHTYA